MLNCRSPRGPGNVPSVTGICIKNHTNFHIDFRRSFFRILPPFLVVFFNDFSCFCHYLFEAVFLMIVYSFLDRSLNCVNPEIIEISLVLIGYFA